MKGTLQSASTTNLVNNFFLSNQFIQLPFPITKKNPLNIIKPRIKTNQA